MKMRDKARWIRLALAMAACAVVLFPTVDALARAGGGTSHSSSSGYSSRRSSSSSYGSSSTRWNSNRNRRNTSQVYASGGDYHPPPPFSLIAILMGALFVAGLPLVILSQMSRAKGAPAPRRPLADRAAGLDQLQRMAREDDGWSLEHMQKRISETYHAVQQAWTERDQELARDYMSPRLYAKHKRMTDAMRAEGRRNVLEDIRLLNIEIVHVADHKGTHDDEFSVVITGSMIDYEVKDAAPGDTVTQLAGIFQQMKSPPREFQELWKFTRDDRGWVLDKIDQDLSVAYGAPRSFSEDVAS